MQTIEIRPGLVEERDVSPEEAAPLLEALALADAERLEGVVSAEDLFGWAEGAARIPDRALADVWLSTETALSVGGGDCEEFARVFRAACALAGIPAAILVEEEDGEGGWHFAVEWADPAQPDKVLRYDPRDRPPVVPDSAEYGGILDAISSLAKKVAPAIGGAAVKALTGDFLGAATGLAGAAVRAARGTPAAPKAAKERFFAPVQRAAVQEAPALQRGLFYSVGSDGVTVYASSTGRPGTWVPTRF